MKRHTSSYSSASKKNIKINCIAFSTNKNEAFIHEAKKDYWNVSSLFLAKKQEMIQMRDTFF